MQRFLSIDNIVEVKSVGVGEKFTLSRLNALGILKFDATNPQETIQYYTGSKEIFIRYGSGQVFNFAKIYFGFTSKAVTTPEVLGIYTWNQEPIAGYLLGARSPSIESLKKINGKFAIEIDGVEKDIELDLTGEGILSYDNVASAIQTALRTETEGGFAGATCIYSPIRSGFIIGSGTTGAESSVSGLTSPSDGTDISDKLGLSIEDAIFFVKGKEGVPTLEAMLEDIASINGNYYTLTPLFKFENETEDLKTFGSFLKEQQDRYLGIYLWDNIKLGMKGSGVVDALLDYDGLYIDWERVENQNAFSSAIIASMDLGKNGGYFNINFNTAEAFKEKAVSKQADFDGMNTNRANAPYVFGELGQSTTAYGQGHIMGYTSSANVYINNSYLKFQMEFAIANLFTNSRIIPLRGESGFSLVRTSLTPIFRSGIEHGLIAIDKLSPEEQNMITQNFQDGEEAVSSLELNGWYLESGEVDTAKKQITMKYVYIANAPVNRVMIKNYILGV